MNFPSAPRLTRVTLLDALAHQIEEWIVAGDLDPGARLPSEGEIADQFSVSRPLVREALARLRERGLVETVTGSGTYVRHPDAADVSDVLLRQLRIAGRSSGDLAGLFEARTAIEVATAALAAERATSEEVDGLAAIHAELADPATDITGFTNGDTEFHLAIARASHNPYMATLLEPLLRVIRVAVTAQPHARAVPIALGGHADILKQIQRRKPDAAAAAMRTHMHDARELRFGKNR